MTWLRSGKRSRIGLSVTLVIAVLMMTGCAEQHKRSATRSSVDTLRVLSYNIHHAEGMDGAVDLERIADLINRLEPDVVALQEVDQLVERTERVDQAMVLGELTGLTPVFGAFMVYQGGQYGMALLSRWKVVDATNVRLPDGEEPRSSVVAVLESPTTRNRVVIAGIHFYRTEEERMAQAKTLVTELKDRSKPVILVGDFNSQPGSTVMQYLEREWSVMNKGENRFTFPSYAPAREIDFIVARRDAELELLSHEVLNEPVMSDHQPIFAEILIHATFVDERP